MRGRQRGRVGAFTLERVVEGEGLLGEGSGEGIGEGRGTGGGVGEGVGSGVGRWVRGMRG